MNRLLPLCAAALVACSSDSVAVDPDAIDGAEKAAVQAALNVALKDDPLYPTLAFLVFPFIDRASHVSTVNGEARFVGIELDIRSEEHTSELQSRLHLVCRLLLEKKKKNIEYIHEMNEKRTH